VRRLNMRDSKKLKKKWRLIFNNYCRKINYSKLKQQLKKNKYTIFKNNWKARKDNWNKNAKKQISKCRNGREKKNNLRINCKQCQNQILGFLSLITK
jgi:hypothetical protein